MDKQEQQVTKPKNEGRVAAGRKLAEWNRKNKENLIKNKEQVKSSGESSAPTSATSSTTLYGGVGIALVAGIYFWKINAVPEHRVQPENDNIFKIN